MVDIQVHNVIDDDKRTDHRAFGPLILGSLSVFDMR